MKRAKDTVDIELLRAAVSYDPKTGAFTWLERPADHFKTTRGASTANASFAGKPAFIYLNNHGYKMGGLFNKKISAHRAAFALMMGRWPVEEIDHINGDRADNRWKNLREASAFQNHQNQKIHRDNTSGVMGVSWNKAAEKWVAYIQANGAFFHLGRFACKTAAVVARRAAELKFGFHENHGRAV